MCPKPCLTARFSSPECTIAAIQILAGVFQAENQAPQKITVCFTGVNIFAKNSHNLPQAVKFNCPFVVLLYVNTIYLSLDQERIFWQLDEAIGLSIKRCLGSFCVLLITSPGSVSRVMYLGGDAKFNELQVSSS